MILGVVYTIEHMVFKVSLFYLILTVSLWLFDVHERRDFILVSLPITSKRNHSVDKFPLQLIPFLQ